MSEQEVIDIDIEIPGVESEEVVTKKRITQPTEREEVVIDVPFEVSKEEIKGQPPKTSTRSTATRQTVTRTKLPAFIDNVTVQELSDILSYILMYFKPRTITISLEPRDFPPVVEPSSEGE
jgi:hypothetical protein